MIITRTLRTANVFSDDLPASMNGFAGMASHLMLAPLKRIADACDVAGLLVMRRAAWPSACSLYRAAGREGQRSRRSLFSCLRYLSELT